MDEIVRDIGAISRALDSISNIEFKEVDLTRGQYLYLVRICEHPGIIPEQLAEIKGLIQSMADNQNRKIKKLYATNKGKEIYPLIIREHHYSNQIAVKGLTTQEIKQLQKLLKKVRENVSEDWNFVKKGNKRVY